MHLLLTNVMFFTFGTSEHTFSLVNIHFLFTNVTFLMFDASKHTFAASEHTIKVTYYTFTASKCTVIAGKGLFIGAKFIFSVFLAGDWMLAAGKKTSSIGKSLSVGNDHEKCNIYCLQPGFSSAPTNKKYLHTRVAVFPLYTCVLQHLLLL